MYSNYVLRKKNMANNQSLSMATRTGGFPSYLTSTVIIVYFNTVALPNQVKIEAVRLGRPCGHEGVEKCQVLPIVLNEGLGSFVHV